MLKQEREIWIDDVKVVACILVLLGHLMQSMTKSNIVPSSDLYLWFNKTIYYFHVPLFFICSGYLYQKISKVDSVNSWGKNVLKKLIALAVPYFTFTTATWLIKVAVPGNGASEVDDIFKTLFLEPTSPYWYLYALFFIFLITPTFNSRKASYIGLGIAVAMKIVSVAEATPEILGGGDIYSISTVLANEIWFVIGMTMCVIDVRRFSFKKSTVGIVIGAIFLILSILFRNSDNGFLKFFLGLMACVAVVLFFMDKTAQGKIMKFLSMYTMPIFLMHSIFAATLRAVLLKLGISSALAHIPLGVAISIFGPVVAAIIMKKTKYPEFFIYPGKFLKI